METGQFVKAYERTNKQTNKQTNKAFVSPYKNVFSFETGLKNDTLNSLLQSPLVFAWRQHYADFFVSLPPS